MGMRFFDHCSAGDVQEISLKGPTGIEADILSLGATLRCLRVPDKDGKIRDVVLGYDTAQSYYEGNSYFGATVGRFANRIAGAKITLDGKEYPLAANERGNQLHGGPDGFSRRNWTVVVLNEEEALFRLYSPDGDMGFPGWLEAEVRYSLAVPGELHLYYRAVSDKKTVISLTNHTYFNLNGHDAGSAASHRLQVAADAYTPADVELIPTGEICPLDGEAVDLRKERRLSELFADPRLAAVGGLDHNYVLRPGKGEKAVLSSEESGLRLSGFTDRPGLQVYTASGLGEERGKAGAVYHRQAAVCLETQAFPDAMHHENFPSVILEAGEVWESETVYRFEGGKPPKKKRAGHIIRL